MFESIFVSPYTQQRHRRALFCEERIAYLQHMRAQGSARHSLRQTAEHLVWLTLRMAPEARNGIDADGLNRLFDEPGAKNSSTPYQQRLLLEARRWFQFLGWWREDIQRVEVDPALVRFVDWMRNERGLSPNTIASWSRWTGHFLRWCHEHDHDLSSLCPQDIDAYLATYSAKGWGRRSVGFIVAMMRVFLRQAASRGECTNTLAGAIFGPRVYALESVPAALSWDEVQQVLATASSATEQDIRDRAILMLMAIYGLRRGEIVALRLDQIDWTGRLLHIWRLKRHQPQVYPLVQSVAQALAQYIDVARPTVDIPQVFITLKAPRKAMPPQTLYELVRHRLRAIGVDRPKMGPHALRHACASRMLAQGLTLKEIGDHLGHSSTQATMTYTKVDMTALREVGNFDLGGVQ
jgi:integrase/recombinase XerD